ncbi:hypothetical protein CH292_17890 [Rhodococcus sp. 14-2470-1a]|nr:GAF and ANTAR domain-containing protein [Rhodococcus sp. 15-1154-1]OZE79209.1 hypothetical protein CH304_19735 [Rhodococcus sp. 15-649-1-2]OZF01024.1 hypothetical protein CH300_18835 [Rhodococcus sp. 15-1154-1]OZF47320.1 hypothetical protein CH292_17890 [Rhodococcus sp. 14-2470-1a]
MSNPNKYGSRSSVGAKSIVESWSDIRRPNSGSDTDRTCQNIVDLAVATVGCTGASITAMTDRARPIIVAATDPAVMRTALEVASITGYSATEAVIDGRRAVVVDDMATEPDRPEYSQEILARTGVRSTASFLLLLDDVELGVMTFYSTEPRTFTHDVLDRCARFADQSALRLAYASARERADHLASALVRSREIGIAIGVVMATATVDRDAAFDMLRRESSLTNRKLHEIASETARTGEVPGLRVP